MYRNGIAAWRKALCADALMRRLLPLAFLLVACSDPPARPRPAAPSVVEPVADTALLTQGHAAIERFECTRCHAIEGFAEVPRERSCVTCHQAILDGTFEAEPEDLARWQSHIRHLIATPSLAHLGDRFEASWAEAFLLSPTDLRPHLLATMPRLAMTEGEAHAIAAYLTHEHTPHPAWSPLTPSEAELAEGRAHFERHACARCHAFSGVDAPSLATTDEPGALLAPDLAITRTRYRRAHLRAWLMNPASFVPDTAMPNHSLDEEAASRLAQFILFAPLREAERAEPPALLPLLDRTVAYGEVDAAVFHATCRHCHADPAFAFGDGGPGNTGGYGFEGRGLELATYAGLHQGVRVNGARVSLFADDGSGMPRLIHALRARQLEEHGQVDATIRGMPLGHSALTPEALQLVRTWVAQGHRRE